MNKEREISGEIWHHRVPLKGRGNQNTVRVPWNVVIASDCSWTLYHYRGLLLCNAKLPQFQREKQEGKGKAHHVLYAIMCWFLNLLNFWLRFRRKTFWSLQWLYFHFWWIIDERYFSHKLARVLRFLIWKIWVDIPRDFWLCHLCQACMLRLLWLGFTWLPQFIMLSSPDLFLNAGLSFICPK